MENKKENYKQIDENLAAYFKALRKSKKLSSEKAGELIGISGRSLRRLEKRWDIAVKVSQFESMRDLYGFNFADFDEILYGKRFLDITGLTEEQVEAMRRLADSIRSGSHTPVVEKEPAMEKASDAS